MRLLKVGSGPVATSPFQSSPPSGRGCAVMVELTDEEATRFQSSPPSGRGCAVPSGGADTYCLKFQSSPPSGRGCAAVERMLRRFRRVVSILTPFGKGMRRRGKDVAALPARGFNPHPLREGDAPAGESGHTSHGMMFQSSPPSGRGCAWLGCWLQERPAQVSILTPFGKGMRPAVARPRRPFHLRFNPHPLREGDAPAIGQCFERQPLVSILTPFGKGMRHYALGFINGRYHLFQSSPPSGRGCA